MNDSLISLNFLRLRRLFYFVTPSECMYSSVDSVPDYILEAFPFFILMILVEIIIISRKRHKYTGVDASDSISSISAGILSQMPLLFSKSIEVVTYLWVFENFKIINLSQSSSLVWILGMFGVDFGYYWVHRFSHEVSLFWSGHQTHHSSQRYNLTTALRQGVFQKYFSWMFYLPMAFFIPPSIFVVHIQFNLLYQFWIHTEVVGKLGFLEYFLNTPSHHRVHHGRNKYCIDKNYGGTLIIFDRIFGTFEEEHEKVTYGLVHTVETWNPIEIQICHFRYVFQQFLISKGLTNKLKSLFYGPGWVLGTKRLGDPDQIPNPEYPIIFYRKNIKTFLIVYCCINFFLTILTYLFLSTMIKNVPRNLIILITFMILSSLIQIGRILDGIHVFWSECLRMTIIVAIITTFTINNTIYHV